MNRDADVRDATTVRANPRPLRVRDRFDAKLAAQIDRNCLKFGHVAAGGEVQRVECEHRVARDLPRLVQHRTATATYPANRPVARGEFGRARSDVDRAAFAPDRDSRRVFAEDQCRGVAVAGGVVHEPALQREERVEVEAAE